MFCAADLLKDLTWQQLADCLYTSGVSQILWIKLPLWSISFLRALPWIFIVLNAVPILIWWFSPDYCYWKIGNMTLYKDQANALLKWSCDFRVLVVGISVGLFWLFIQLFPYEQPSALVRDSAKKFIGELSFEDVNHLVTYAQLHFWYEFLWVIAWGLITCIMYVDPHARAAFVLVIPDSITLVYYTEQKEKKEKLLGPGRKIRLGRKYFHISTDGRRIILSDQAHEPGLIRVTVHLNKQKKFEYLQATGKSENGENIFCRGSSSVKIYRGKQFGCGDGSNKSIYYEVR